MAEATRAATMMVCLIMLAVVALCEQSFRKTNEWDMSVCDVSTYVSRSFVDIASLLSARERANEKAADMMVLSALLRWLLWEESY